MYLHAPGNQSFYIFSILIDFNGDRLCFVLVLFFAPAACASIGHPSFLLVGQLLVIRQFHHVEFLISVVILDNADPTHALIDQKSATALTTAQSEIKKLVTLKTSTRMKISGFVKSTT